MITSLWRQNDVATSFCRHNHVSFASCVRWGQKKIFIWKQVPRPTLTEDGVAISGPRRVVRHDEQHDRVWQQDGDLHGDLLSSSDGEGVHQGRHRRQQHLRHQHRIYKIRRVPLHQQSKANLGKYRRIADIISDHCTVSFSREKVPFVALHVSGLVDIWLWVIEVQSGGGMDPVCELNSTALWKKGNIPSEVNVRTVWWGPGTLTQCLVMHLFMCHSFGSLLFQYCSAPSHYMNQWWTIVNWTPSTSVKF